MTRVFLDAHNPRVLCECCGLPTLIVPDLAPGVPDYACTMRDCPLCEWENAAVDKKGETAFDSANDAAERNGGHTLAEAQRNFSRFLSMYDPAQPEPWMPEPPTREEVRSKEELVRLYKRIVDPYDVDARDVLKQIFALESTLYEAEQARIDDAEVAIEPEDDAAADVTGGAWEPKRGDRGAAFFTGTGHPGEIWPPVEEPEDPSPEKPTG